MKSKAFWRHSSMMWLFLPPPHVIWHWCCAFAWLCTARDDKARVFLGYLLLLWACVCSRVKKQTMQCRCHKQKGKEKERTRSASYDHWSIKHSISEHNAHISCKEPSRGRSTSYARTETQQYKRMISVFVTLFLSRWLSKYFFAEAAVVLFLFLADYLTVNRKINKEISEHSNPQMWSPNIFISF